MKLPKLSLSTHLSLLFEVKRNFTEHCEMQSTRTTGAIFTAGYCSADRQKQSLSLAILKLGLEWHAGRLEMHKEKR